MTPSNNRTVTMTPSNNTTVTMTPSNNRTVRMSPPNNNYNTVTMSLPSNKNIYKCSAQHKYDLSKN